jgi:circadian clock protein KaiC
MSSIGIDLEPHVRSGLLRIQAARPTLFGLEMHLASMYDALRDFRPKMAVVDPITDFMAVGTPNQIKAAMTLLIDYLKSIQVTGLLTSLAVENSTEDQAVVGVSSLIDTWITLRNLEVDGERMRGIYVLKSRGMPHSNLISAYIFTNHGLLVDSDRSLSLLSGSGSQQEGFARIQEKGKPR